MIRMVKKRPMLLMVMFIRIVRLNKCTKYNNIYNKKGHKMMRVISLQIQEH